MKFKGHLRRYVTDQEKARFLTAYRGTAGVLLSYRYLLTAEHICITSGQVPGTDYFFNVVKVAEVHYDFDACILEISWSENTELPKNVLFPAKIWSKKNQLQLSSSSKDSLLYHLGYYMYEEAYSEGFALELGLYRGVEFLYFNISSQQGSSGGPIYRKKDNMLVSVLSGPVSGKPRGEFNADDRSGWIRGPALYKLYNRSPI